MPIKNLIDKLAEELYEVDRRTPGRDNGPYEDLSFAMMLKYTCDAKRSLEAIRKVIDAEKKEKDKKTSDDS